MESKDLAVGEREKCDNPEEVKRRNVALLRRIADALEADSDDKHHGVEFLLCAAFKEEAKEDGQEVRGALWGTGEHLMRLLSAVSEPIVKPIVEQMSMGDLKAAAAMSAAAQAQKHDLFRPPSAEDAEAGKYGPN